MAKHSYKVASQDGADRYHAEVGDTVDLEITKDEELAVIAAGWLEHHTTKPENTTKFEFTKTAKGDK